MDGGRGGDVRKTEREVRGVGCQGRGEACQRGGGEVTTLCVVGGEEVCQAVDVVHHDGGLASLVAEQAIAGRALGGVLEEEDGPCTAEVAGVWAEVAVGRADGAAVDREACARGLAVHAGAG